MVAVTAYIPVGICLKNTSKRTDADITLESRVFGERPVQVPLDLVVGDGIQVLRLANHHGVVTGMSYLQKKIYMYLFQT